METKFYQDKSDRMVRGVCAGLARGVGIDAIWLRAPFALALASGFFTAGISSGMVVAVYIALALVMPTKKVEEKPKEEDAGKESGQE